MTFIAFSSELMAVTRRYRDRYEAERMALQIFGKNYAIVQDPPMMTPEECCAFAGVGPVAGLASKETRI